MGYFSIREHNTRTDEERRTQGQTKKGQHKNRRRKDNTRTEEERTTLGQTKKGQHKDRRRKDNTGPRWEPARGGPARGLSLQTVQVQPVLTNINQHFGQH